MGIGDWGLGPISNPHYFNKRTLKNYIYFLKCKLYYYKHIILFNLISSLYEALFSRFK